MQSRILIYVPGFPGDIIPRDPGEIRVIDVISEIASHKKLELEIIKYPGIAREESFSFEKTRTHAYKIIQRKIAAGYLVTLIGQSWGGLIALMAASKFDIDRLILITPFILKISKDEAISILTEYSNEFPTLIPSTSIADNAQDVIKIFQSFESIQNEVRKCNDLRVLAACNDEIIEVKQLRSLFRDGKSFMSQSTFTEQKNDHNFTQGKVELKNWLDENV